MKNHTQLCRAAALATSAALLTASLAGCGGQPAASTAPSTTPSAAPSSEAVTTAPAPVPAIDGAHLLDPKNPTTVTVWNYYNGDQLAAFEALVSEFNDTVGLEKGILVTSVSQGSVDGLADALIDAVNGKIGADDVPSAASVYAETAYILNESEAIVPLDGYFSAEELSGYVPAFLEEGRLRENGALMIMPVSKSTEVFIANTTDWAEFAAATGTELTAVQTYEDLTAAAEAYYNWTDEQTPDVPEDGKALYGRDSVGNYMVLGTKQLGHELFTVAEDGTVTSDLDRDTFKTLWDNYYIPYINGYFGSYGKFRSEDLKTGAILALTGSSSGMSYYSTSVTNAEDVSHDIEISISKSLAFANAVDPVDVQQGAGYCVMKTGDAEQYATVEFLKWFTDTAQNLTFSVTSGYSPVKLDANSADKIKAAFTVDSPKKQNVLDALLTSAEVYTEGNTYTLRPFQGSKQVRTVLEDSLEEVCATDRAAVAAAIAAGTPRAEAVAEYSTDAYFDAWFDTLRARIEAATA